MTLEAMDAGWVFVGGLYFMGGTLLLAVLAYALPRALF